MIFSDTQIKEKSILVRFYFYVDTERGFGDAGTAGYFLVDLKNFEEESHERAVEHGTYWTYKLKEEAGKKMMGNYYWISFGYELADEDKRGEEREKLIKSLEIVQEVKEVPYL